MDREPLDALDLRYYLVTVFGADQPLSRTRSVAELVTAIEGMGLTVDGRPSKRVSDVLRTLVARGWVERVGRGRYRRADLPGTTVRRARRWHDARLAGVDRGECSAHANWRRPSPNGARSWHWDVVSSHG